MYEFIVKDTNLYLHPKHQQLLQILNKMYDFIFHVTQQFLMMYVFYIVMSSVKENMFKNEIECGNNNNYFYNNGTLTSIL